MKAAAATFKWIGGGLIIKSSAAAFMLIISFVRSLISQISRKGIFIILEMVKYKFWDRAALNLPPPQSGPWLLGTSCKHPAGQQIFYSIEERRCYVKRIPYLSRNQICASSHGWMVLRTPFLNCCFLLNMVSMEKILLPPPPPPSCDPMFPWRECILSSTPTDPDCIVAFFNKALPCRVMFCKPGGKKWIQQDFGNWIQQDRMLITHVTAVQKKIYCLTDSNILIRLDVDHVTDDDDDDYMNINMMRLETNRSAPSLSAIDYTHPASLIKSYLVESCGDMFLVQFSFLLDKFEDDPLQIKAFKMNFSNLNWEEMVETLGDDDHPPRALFINAKDNCISCSSSSSVIKGDTIYFLLDGDTSMYVFDMTHNKIGVCEPFPDQVVHNELQTCWVMPS